MTPIYVLASILFSHIGKDPAYLDPGSGSFIIQLIIAGVVGAGFLLRGYWAKIVKFFRGVAGDIPNEDRDDFDDA